MENEINLTERVKLFYNEVVTELKKVTWPTRKQISTSTIVIIVVVFLTAVYLNVADLGFSYIMSLIFK
ncbi:MAG: preprotein translocase subunit SecE [Deltaproteobacteria bacterium]|nr:preprotein translocase subunit SecE [Deltaproteobacteria bacterium]MCL5276520.1 preprotein translocase subunit SecE [Deltaproteobacteria bacterium]